MASTIHVILASGFKGASELFINVLTSGVLEGLFPPFNASHSPWLNLIEGTAEIALYILLAGTASNMLDEVITVSALSQLPYGALLMFWLLEGAVAKINHFVGYVAAKMNMKRTPVAPIVIEDKSAGKEDSMADTLSSSSSSSAPSYSHASSCGTDSCGQ